MDEKSDMIHCATLGLAIDARTGAGKHPLCRGCRSQALGENGPLIKPLGSFTVATKLKLKKRCECGRYFIPRSNRQKSCPRCAAQNEKKQNRARCRRYYQKKNFKKSESHGLEAKFQNQLGIL